MLRQPPTPALAPKSQLSLAVVVPEIDRHELVLDLLSRLNRREGSKGLWRREAAEWFQDLNVSGVVRKGESEVGGPVLVAVGSRSERV